MSNTCLVETQRSRPLPRFVALAIAALVIVGTAPRASANEAEAARAARDALYAMERAGLNVRATYQHGHLYPGQRSTHHTTLLRGNRYVFVAGGCRDAYDIDLYVYDENWNLVARDSLADQVAYVEVTPRWTGTFHIVVEMYDSTRDGAHWILQTGYY